MLLPKAMVVEQLRARGDTDGAERADRELSEKVDTERDADLLASLDIDAAKLADDFDGQSPAVGCGPHEPQNVWKNPADGPTGSRGHHRRRGRGRAGDGAPVRPDPHGRHRRSARLRARGRRGG